MPCNTPIAAADAWTCGARSSSRSTSTSGRRSTPRRWDPQRQRRCAEVEQRGDVQHLHRVRGVEDPHRDRAAREAGHGGDAGQARVRGDEIAAVGDKCGDQRALGDGIRLVEDENAEDLGIQQQVLDVAGHEQTQDAAAEVCRRRDPRVCATPEAVDQRPDERREHEERRASHQQVGDDVWTCCTDGHVEEQ